LRVPYKPVPVKDDPAFDCDYHWAPTLNVQIIYKHARSARIEALVDSGAPWCLFHSQIGQAVGVQIKRGKKSSLGGVIANVSGDVYFHKVKLALQSSIVEIVAGFSDSLSVAAILGRQSFFDNHIVTFDPQTEVPGMEIERFYRS
jgi:hypothetical protein